ncbi:hypothetical protein [Streptomyces sp. NPDC050287]|uniref:hypothetical protein n=1 Tax=Streptomyces sp. NPDC050287 TaxID=3365608 RepID=UPI0037939AC9
MFLLCLGNSLATKEELAANGGYVLFPSNPTFESYNVVLSGGVVTRAAVVSVVITLVGTALSLLCTVALAYGLSRPGTVAGKPLLMIVLGTFLFTPGIIPNYPPPQLHRCGRGRRSDGGRRLRADRGWLHKLPNGTFTARP